MSGKICMAGEDGQLRSMEEQPYEAESLLRKLLAEYPDLLAGDQMRPSSPRRWLLVSREHPVPGDESEAGRWSLDHEKRVHPHGLRHSMAFELMMEGVPVPIIQKQLGMPR